MRCPIGVFVPLGDMPRPTLTPSTLGDKRAGVMNYLAYGWITVPQAAAMLQCHRKTIWRLCALLDIDPDEAMRKRMQLLEIRAERYAHRTRRK